MNITIDPGVTNSRCICLIHTPLVLNSSDMAWLNYRKANLDMGSMFKSNWAVIVCKLEMGCDCELSTISIAILNYCYWIRNKIFTYLSDQGIPIYIQWNLCFMKLFPVLLITIFAIFTRKVNFRPLNSNNKILYSYL